MKKSVAKKTILERFLNMFLPFYCRGCGKTGNLLCGSCKKDIMIIGEVFGNKTNLGDLNRLFVVGPRQGALKKLAEDYKFKSFKTTSKIFAELLDQAIPQELNQPIPQELNQAIPHQESDQPTPQKTERAIPQDSPEIIVVPLPTIKKHIRERGFDHTQKLAEEFAKLRNLPVIPVLKRINKTVQVGADEKTREQQAEKAYAVDETKFDSSKTYLLLDDIWTTGASMRSAAKKLRQSGAKKIYAAAICINRLD